ncbi:MAG: lipid II flippase Amj family protein [Nitrospirota bacterium]|nr:lipid II flippase Amj family protein [Nitrospirota bacterium]
MPLIDDDLTEGDEDVLLFLTVDPKVARLTDDKVVAIIEDDD